MTADDDEVWARIPGGYEVSNLGGVRKIGGACLKQWANSYGYKLVRLNNPRRVDRVHRLVASAFIPNPAACAVVNHIDHVRDNNRASNLEWCSQKDNLHHARLHGRMPRNYWAGRRSPNASLLDSDVRELRRLRSDDKMSFSQLAERFGISKRSVGRLLNRETYSDVQ